jgi:general secretion pathway protein I
MCEQFLKRKKRLMGTDSGRSGRSGREAGFTLIEVLVALGIIAVALMAALRAAGQGTSNVGELRSRLFAGWVAQNVLAEQSVRGDWLPLGSYGGVGHQGGKDFTWREEVLETPNPAFRRINIFVFEAPGESRPLVRLTGFLSQSSAAASAAAAGGASVPAAGAAAGAVK